MKNPSLSPHSIIQPSAPQNMQELASHLICTTCIVHLTPHSIHCTPQAIYAHAQTTGCTICALHTCIRNPCPLRPHHLRCSPHPRLHPPRAPAFTSQSTRSHSPSIPSHSCSWARTPSCHIQIHTHAHMNGHKPAVLFPRGIESDSLSHMCPVTGCKMERPSYYGQPVSGITHGLRWNLTELRGLFILWSIL